MPALKITKFLGTSPKVSPELTAESVAQEAVNVKLYSGDLIPYNSPSFSVNLQRSGAIKSIYPMDDGAGGLKWLSWLTDVDVAVATSLNDEEQRIYFTGSGVPKATNYTLAVGATSGPFPDAAYDLGLPIPTAVPTATPSSFSAVAITDVARDTGDIITFGTSGAHGLRTGNVISVTGHTNISGTYSRTGTTNTITITGHELQSGEQVTLSFTSGTATPGTYTITVTGVNTFTVEDVTSGSTSGNVLMSMTSYNVSNAVCTVVDSTHLTVFGGGFQQDEYAITDGEITLAGTTLSRGYVYTWMTPWIEESVPSEPSSLVYVKEGQTVALSGLPNSGPGGNNQISGIRLYRTVTGATGTDYFLLKTIWFPRTATFAERTSNVVTLTVSEPHNLTVGDYVKVDGIAFGGAPDTSFDEDPAEVASVVDDYTFTYAATGSDKAETATTAGTLYWDVSEDNDGSVFYESTTFTDDFLVSGLSIVLDSLFADAPDDEMQGLRVAQNNILIGFVDNELCFSDPDKPWSWPIKYRLVFEYNIVAVEAIAGSILVMTEKYPYIVSGSNPANMSSSRIDVVMPCIAKRGVVNMGFGVVYPTHGGLALFSPSSGAGLVTKLLHDWDTWTTTNLDPTTIRATFYEGKYFGSHDNGSIIFEREDKVGGLLSTTPIKAEALYYDAENNELYYVANQAGRLNKWDDATQPFLSMSWKSKVFITADYTNIGAVRVVADYGDVAAELANVQAFNATVPTTNAAWWALLAELGTLNGPVDYTDPDTSTYTPVYGTLNETVLNGDPLTTDLLSEADVGAAGFKVWAEKELKTTVSIPSSDIFRIPGGYKSDTFEVGVSGKVRVRSIHFGETPYGLRAV